MHRARPAPVAVTADSVPDTRTVRVCGPVRGVKTVEDRGAWGEGYAEEVIGDTADAATALMIDAAAKKGATAVVGYRLLTTNHHPRSGFGSNYLTVTAYGTAVVLEDKHGGHPKVI